MTLHFFRLDTSIAPEIWDHNVYSKKSDVYAFSMVSFEILTLQELYHEIDIFTLMGSIGLF